MDQLLRVFLRKDGAASTAWCEVGCIKGSTPPGLVRSTSVDDAGCMDDFLLDCDQAAEECISAPPAATIGELSESQFQFSVLACHELIACPSLDEGDALSVVEFYENQVRCPEKLECVILYPDCTRQVIQFIKLINHTWQSGTKGGGKWQADITATIAGDWSWIKSDDTATQPTIATLTGA